MCPFILNDPVVGKCALPVTPSDNQSDTADSRDTEFTVVHNLAHNAILGWDYLSQNGVILNCSSDQAPKVKVRTKKPINIPAKSALCLSVKIDQSLSDEGEYLFVGQQLNDIEVCDALITPFSDDEIPIYVRNRSERVVTIHRRSVIGYVERVEHVETCDPKPDAEVAVEINAVIG